MNREDIIKAMQATAGGKPTAVKVKEWGTVYVRAISVAEAEEQAAETEDEAKRRITRGAARVLCDETGKLLFDANSPDDLEFLGRQPWPMLRKVLAAADGPDDSAKGNALAKVVEGVLAKLEKNPDLIPAAEAQKLKDAVAAFRRTGDDPGN